MKYKDKLLHCEKRLIDSLQVEITDITNVIEAVKWNESFSISLNNEIFDHQRAYNKAFEIEFLKYGWKTQPKIKDSPRLIGDFSKGLVFIEVQFGNSSTLYRDFYKFQYGLQNGLFSLAVLIVPYDEYEFFPTRPNKSVRNMANFKLAERYFTVLPISAPTWIIGLLPTKGYKAKSVRVKKSSVGGTL